MIHNERLGEENINTQGCTMKIIEYFDNNYITVMFDNDEKHIVKNTYYSNFKKGRIKNPWAKTIAGVGYIGYDYRKQPVSNLKSYSSWTHMLSRCYDKTNKHFEIYGGSGVTVSDEWLSFFNYKKWYDENYYEIENDKMVVDKDILMKNNKIYSKDTCIIVPSKINKLFVKEKSIRGNYPIGVCYHKQISRYVAKLTINNKEKHLGCFDTEVEAFNAYKIAKEKHIEEVANEYKDKIPQKLYDAMINYEVEIGD
jgi:hypothetical protein